MQDSINKKRHMVTLDENDLEQHNELRKQKFYGLPLSTRIQQLIKEDLRRYA